ncbi:MAG: DUF2852 domain-containing protein [Acetobacteraceae bacterium]
MRLEDGGWQRGAWQGPRPPWAGGWKSFWCGSGGGGSQTRAWQQPSGNRAFDEYRAETLRRLEDEQKEFTDFLDRLRVAKDKAEFDQFMSERRSRPPAPPAEVLAADRLSASLCACRPPPRRGGGLAMSGTFRAWSVIRAGGSTEAVNHALRQ